MDIYPHDLGNRRWTNVLRRRARAHLLAGGAYDPFEVPAQRNAGRMRRSLLGGIWTRGLNLDDTEEAQATSILKERHRGLSVAGSVNTGILIGTILLLPIGGMIASADSMVAIAAAAGWCTVAAALQVNLPRSVLRRLHGSPITTEEIQALRLATPDRLERTFLSLVLDAAARSVPAPVQADIRDALRRLGEATASIPPAMPPRDRDPGKLRSDAHALRVQAQRESDPAVAASYNRQADTLERRADVAGAADTPADRRRHAIREELRLQMETLRSTLTALETGSADAAEVAALAASVQRVAAGTAAVTSARNELDDEEIARMRGVPATPVNEAPQEAKVPLQWWR